MIFLTNIELLFYRSAHIEKNSSFKRHFHDYWQMEILNKGKVKAVIGKETISLSSKDLVVIPPGTPHSFNYIDDSEVINMSFKFCYDSDFDDQKFKFDKILSEDCICSFLWGYPNNSDYITEKESLILQHMLSGLFSIYYNKQNSQNFPNIFVQALEYIQTNQNRYITVSSVANHVNSSSGYLSALFRKYKKISLKKYLDSSRMEYIRKYLIYSDLLITEIAEESGFEDVYSFSRFVKTQAGLSPLNLKNKLKSGGNTNFIV
jgi:AraC-like DNA-binding protein